MNSTPSGSQGSAPPLAESQWSRRYNISTLVPSVGNGLSWMDPQYPSLDVDTLQPTNAPGPGQRYLCPNPEALDSLFLSEQLQSRSCALRTWEAAVLTSMNPYMEPSDEHTLGRDLDLEPKRSCTIIDESQWMSVWQQERWNLDFRNPEVGVRWSVDEPHIWHAMRPSIDLADRIIKAACNHKWMATFVNPFHVTALKGVELPLHNPQNRKGTIWKMLDMDPRYLLSPADTLEMLSQLLVTTRFGFYDQYNTQDPTHVVDAYTFPTPYPDGARGPADANTVQSQIIVSVELIQPLIDGNLPAHTRRTTQVILGITLAHELMHAAFLEQLRRHKKLLFQPYPMPSGFIETYDYMEHVNELGESLEKALFGYRLNEVARPHASYWIGPRYRNRVLFLLGAHVWPTRSSFAQSYGIQRHQLPESQRAPVPSIYHFWLMSMPFWHNVVDKYGLDALRIPRMLNSSFNEGYSVAGWNQDPGVGASPLAPPLKRLARLLHKARLQWHEWREPWYKETLTRWQLTPYSDGRKRTQLDYVINTLMTGRTRMDEWQIVSICHDWMEPYHWPSCRLLHPNDRDGKDLEKYRRTDWFYRALAMLISAAIPTHPVPFKEYIRPDYPVDIPWTIRTGSNFFSLAELQARQFAVMDCLKLRGAAGDEVDLYYPSYGFDKLLPMGLKEYRTRLIQVAKSFWRNYEVNMAVVPRGLKTAFDNACENLQQQVNRYAVFDIGNNLATDSWLDFNFRLPPYGDLGSDRVFGIGDAVKLQAAARADTFGQVILEPDNVEDLPVWALAGTTVSSNSGLLDENLDLSSMRPFTISEVYDHAESVGRTMVLVDRTSWAGIYDWQQVARCLGLDATTPGARTIRTQEGRFLRPDDTQRFLAMDAAARPVPVGRLIRVVREEDPTLWTQTSDRSFVTILGDVYDITGVRFDESSSAQRNMSRILRKNAGGNPQEDLWKADINIAEVVEMLRPARVAVVQQRVTPVLSDQVFTRAEVKCHRYRKANTGLYIIIRNNVYDIKDYANFHPGGVNHLLDFGGQDATKAFEEMHHDPDGLLERMDYLRIGRIIDEYDPSQPIPEGCVRLHNRIYNIRTLMNDEATRGLGERLLAYEGKTLNHEPKPSRPQGGVEHELATMLSQRWEAIVGKIPMLTGRVIPEITANELAQFYFEVNVAEKYYRQAFVAAINEKGEWLVYDVTDAMLYGSELEKTRLTPWLGGAIKDVVTTSWIRKTFDVYTVARLVEDSGKTANQVDWEPVRRLTDEDAAIELPKPTTTTRGFPNPLEPHPLNPAPQHPENNAEDPFQKGFVEEGESQERMLFVDETMEELARGIYAWEISEPSPPPKRPHRIAPQPRNTARQDLDTFLARYQGSDEQLPHDPTPPEPWGPHGHRIEEALQRIEEHEEGLRADLEEARRFPHFRQISALAKRAAEQAAAAEKRKGKAKATAGGGDDLHHMNTSVEDSAAAHTALVTAVHEARRSSVMTTGRRAKRRHVSMEEGSEVDGEWHRQKKVRFS